MRIIIFQPTNTRALLKRDKINFSGYTPKPDLLSQSSRLVEDNFTNINHLKIKRIFEKQMNKFPEDIQYRKNILASLELNSNDYYKLRPIIGVQELTSITKKLKEKNYSPGILEYKYTGKIIKSNFVIVKNDKSNVANYTYGANLHLHTKNSDGLLTVQELLDQAANYADERIQKTGKKTPFIVAITDHDTVNGNKEAVDIILNNPNKYKNIRVVLGVETSTTFHESSELIKPSIMHLLAYCINPKEKGWDNLLGPFNKQSIRNKKQVISNANQLFKDVLKENNLTYSFKDATKLAPSLAQSRCLSYYMKDYLQLRLLYAHTVENNKLLVDFLNKNKVNVDKDLNYVEPRDRLSLKLDYNKGQTYWGYYYDSLKNYVKDVVKEKNPKFSEQELESTFIKLDDSKLIKTFNEIESGCYDYKSPIHTKGTEVNEFNYAVRKIAKMKHGVMGIAHPELIYPENCLKDGGNPIKYIEDLYRNFKENGKEKAKFSENFYKSGGIKPDVPFIKEIKRISSKNNLLPTGSLDTHAKSIFVSNIMEG